MKFVLLFTICVSSALALPSIFPAAEQCNSQNCRREDDCVCASSVSPIEMHKTPQLITLTFDDSVTDLIYDKYLEKLLLNRKNPDGKPISATFYVPHPYSSYVRVNDLYNKGFDIGVNSISKDMMPYWQSASVEQLMDEFEGQRKIISKFANIPIGDIKGARTPHFEINGDATFYAYDKSGLVYDNSWITFSNNSLFPYTLDYKLEGYPCLTGKCPTQPHPKAWILPIINNVGENGIECNVLFSCQINDTVGEIRDWLITQYRRREFDRAPMNLLVTSAWFDAYDNTYEGLTQFLDYVGSRNDTFLVSHSEVIRWSKNPVEFDKYQTNHHTKNESCQPKNCWLQFGEFETRIMPSCVTCPVVYPWLGNHYGQP